MAQSKLLKVSYKDSANGIRLTNYADTLIFREDKPSKPGDQSTKTLAAIRFGGYPEQVRTMADAIYGGGDIEAERKNGIWALKALTKQYHRQASADGVYAHSANRSYYAIFHAIRSVLALEGIDFKKHSAIIAHFQQHYIKTGIFDRKYSDYAKEAFSIRTDSDYEDFFVVSKEEADEQLKHARQFIAAVQKHIGE